MSFAVVIPSRNLGNLAQCVTAVYKHEPEARVVVVDDSEKDYIYSFCMQSACVQVRGKKPFVFSRNVNLGIECAMKYGAEGVVILNDDALLETPGGFTALRDAARSCPDYGIISSTCNNVGNTRQYRSRLGGLREERRMVCFVAVYIPATTIEKVGLLDERFVTYGWEDNDYCRRIRNAGLKIGIHEGCFVNHAKLHSTFRGAGGPGGDIEPGKQIYLSKWGDLD
jgi:GT2 family glycosyltransferase